MRLTTFAFLPCAALLAGAVSAQNLLLNPGFENGLNGWQHFGPNVTAEQANPTQGIVPQSGTALCKMYGHFSGQFNVSGVYHSQVAQPGQAFSLSCASRHWSGDPMIGAGSPNDNFAVMKIAFFDANSNEVAGVERTIMDGTFPTDTWIANAPIIGVTPFGAIRCEALILFLQPAMDGGSAMFDDVDFSPTANPAIYPGTREDLFLATAVAGGPLSSGQGNEVKTATGGDLLEFNVSSPGGSFDMMGYWLVGDLFTTGSPPTPLSVYPELWFGLTSHFILVNGIPTPIGPPLIRPNGGSSSFFMAPPGLNGISLMVQGLIINPVVTNGIYAATDAHEIQFQ